MAYWGQFDDEYAVDRYIGFYRTWLRTAREIVAGIGAFGFTAAFQAGLNGIVNKIIRSYL